MMKSEVMLNTGSTIDEGRLAKGGNKLSQDYRDECAVCQISFEDFIKLGKPSRVKVTSKDTKYEICVNAIPKDSVMPGQVFMPRSIWANVVVDPETQSTGSPLYKGSVVQIEPTDEEVLTAEDIFKKIYLRE